MSNYYVSSFFWSTCSKLLTAVVGFFTVPILLGLWGKADYGVLSIATACNGYLQLMDLGMNIGAVKFYSQWKMEGDIDKVYRVANSNTLFYAGIAVVNMIVMTSIAIWGENIFSITSEQFLILRKCLLVIVFFSIPTWITTSYNQLLIADKQMAFTQKWQCVSSLLKGLLVVLTIILDFSIPAYFFLFTMAVSILIIPYFLSCKKRMLIGNFHFKFYWDDFKVVLMYSLAIFALSLFQSTATQSRPIILGMSALNGAESVSEFKIMEVVPQFIIMIGGTFSGIFLPKTSEMVAANKKEELERFAYKWTILTSILACFMCYPLLLCSKEILGAYVGSQYTNLSGWLSIWLVCTLCQIHSTPTNAMILAYGKTKIMVYVAAIACLISMVINACLAKQIGVGSAVVGYAVYIAINLFSYYGYYYKHTLHISIKKILYSFLSPTIIGLLVFVILRLLFSFYDIKALEDERLNYLSALLIKSITFVVLYGIMLASLKIISFMGKKVLTKYDF